MSGFRRILVAVDPSEQAARAVQVTGELASRLGAEVIVFHGLEARLSGGGLAGDPPLPVTAWETREEAEEMAEAFADGIRALGVEVTVRISDTYEPVARSILEAIEEYQPDLVVVGSHGRSGLHELLLGSVADKLVRSAPCPVLLVRAART